MGLKPFTNKLWSREIKIKQHFETRLEVPQCENPFPHFFCTFLLSKRMKIWPPTATKQYLAKATYSSSYYWSFESAKDLWLWNISASGGRMSRVFLKTEWCIGGRNTFLKQTYGISEGEKLSSLTASSGLVGVQRSLILVPTSSAFCLCNLLWRTVLRAAWQRRRVDLRRNDRRTRWNHWTETLQSPLTGTLHNPPRFFCSYRISGNIWNFGFQLCYEILSLQLWNLITRSTLWHWYHNQDELFISIELQSDTLVTMRAGSSDYIWKRQLWCCFIVPEQDSKSSDL